MNCTGNPMATCENPKHFDVICRCGKVISRRTCNAAFARIGTCHDCAVKATITGEARRLRS